MQLNEIRIKKVKLKKIKLKLKGEVTTEVAEIWKYKATATTICQ